MKRHLKLILFISLTFLSGRFQAQDFSIHGFAQVNYSVRVANTAGLTNIFGKPLPDYILGDERLQLEVTRYGSVGGLLAKVDLYYDALNQRANIDIREAYVDLNVGNFDIRTGRQIITWGVGDLVFINDVFPKDWIAFLSGRPLEYLKIGSDAFNVNYYGNYFSVQVIAIPFYQPDILPKGDRLTAYNPFPSAAGQIERLPEISLGNTQFAARLYRNLGNFDLSLYGYRGFYPSPPGIYFNQSTNVTTTFYPRLNVYGASLQGAFMNGVLGLEGGYYDSRDDADGTNPGIENSQVRFLVSYQRTFSENFTIGLQYFGEQIQKYSQYIKSLPKGFPQRKEFRHTLGLRLTRLLNYQTLRLSFFTLYSPNDKDYYINPEIRYELGDGVWASAGSVIMGGKKNYTFFGQFEKNDNLYLVLRYEF